MILGLKYFYIVKIFKFMKILSCQYCIVTQCYVIFVCLFIPLRATPFPFKTVNRDLYAIDLRIEKGKKSHDTVPLMMTKYSFVQLHLKLR